MKVLLVTDSAVLRRSISQALVDRGHDPRALTRADDRPPTHWPARVEPRPAPPQDISAVLRAADGCAAAIVIDDRLGRVGRADGDPGAFTAAAAAALSDRGMRTLLVSGRVAGGQAQPSSTKNTSLRITSDAVYGTGEDAVSLFLIMMRTLPAVPLLSATHQLRPLWHEDLARGLAAALALEPSSLSGALDFAGPESITYEALYERIAVLIDRRPLRLPIPDFLAAHGARLAELLHLGAPFDTALLQVEQTPVSSSDGLRTLQIDPTPLDAGLRRLANELPEMVPSQGVGRLEIKRFHADITGSPHRASDLLGLFRSRFSEVMPITVGSEPVSPQTALDPDAVITMTLPARGHVQIRVAEVTDDHVVGVTLQGHALAGCVRFSARDLGPAVCFEVTACETASNPLDWLTLTLGGARLQDANWKTVVENVVKLSGGRADDVKSEARRLSPEEAEQADSWIRALVERRESAAPAPAPLLESAAH